MPGYDADNFDLVMPPAPIRIRESDHTVLDPDGPMGRFADAQAVIDAIGGLVEHRRHVDSIPHPGPPATSLTEHLEHLAWGAENVMPLFHPE